jgi:HK97 gp10 family phage protein
MAASFTVNFKELDKALRAIGKVLDDKNIRRIVKPAAKIVQAAARQNLSGHERTGITINSIGIINGKSVTQPAVLVGALISKRAFHAHLLEEGTDERFPKKKKLLRFKDQNGNWVSAASVAPMPALYFMAKAIQSSEGEVKKAYEKALARELKKIEKGQTA